MSTQQTVSEIVEKIEGYERDMEPIFQENREISDKFRLIPGKSPGQKGLSQAVAAEMQRAVEALATVWYKQLFAQAPNFSISPMRPGISADDIRQHVTLLEAQNKARHLKVKAFKALRQIALFGGIFIDNAFRFSKQHGLKYTSFESLEIDEVAFDRTVPDIANANWICPLYWISVPTLRKFIAEDAPRNVWDHDAIEREIESSKHSDNVPSRVKQRLQAAGYNPTQSEGVLELAFYQGVMDHEKSYDDNFVMVLNRHTQIRRHKNPFPHRRKQIRYVGVKTFGREPLAYGVGKEGLRLHKQMDANRRKMDDILIQALLGIWKVARTANLDFAQMEMKPFNIVELDNVDSLKPVRPDLNAIGFGMQREEAYRNEFRGLTGAVDGLQAEVTEATLGEVSLAMGEAFRRVSTYGELIGEALLWEDYDRSIKNNQAWIKEPMWLEQTGDKGPLEILPSSISKVVSAQLRMITDKDFAPAKLKSLLQFFQMVTSVRQMMPELNPIVIAEQIGLMLNVDPKRLTEPVPGGNQLDPRRMESRQAFLSEMGRRNDVAGGGGGGDPRVFSRSVGQIPAGVPQGAL